jgi:DNA repair photolyase
MNFEQKKFEEKGLKFDKERVLTYSHLSCPLDCRYCFVEDLNFNQEKNIAYLSTEQFELIENLPEEIKTIMLGCDTEFFQDKADALKTLERLIKTKIDISVITKLSLNEKFIEQLKKIHEKLKEQNNLLVFSVSLPCFESARIWEPGVPTPEKRIKTLKKVFERDIKTLVAIRPLLPTINEKELENIIDATKDFSYGYYSGPLYLKDLDLLENKEKVNLKIEQVQPHWMPDNNIFYKIEKEGQMELLRNMVDKHNKPFFEGAAEAIKYLKNYEES